MGDFTFMSRDQHRSVTRREHLYLTAGSFKGYRPSWFESVRHVYENQPMSELDIVPFSGVKFRSPLAMVVIDPKNSNHT